MANTIVDSLDDPRLAPYRNIRHRDPTIQVADDTAAIRFIAEGRLVVERLLTSRYRCESLLVERDHHPDLVAAALTKDQSTEVIQLELPVLRQLVGFDFHRGILACGNSPPLRRFDQLSDQWFEKKNTEAPLLLVFGVNNPENIGGLMRSAAAFGVSKMGISPDVANPFSRRALRVSMAAAFKMEIFRVHDQASCVRRLSTELGFRTCATALGSDTKPLSEFSNQLAATPKSQKQAVALIMGSESDGLSSAVQAAATDRITIPMHLGTDSLNVNVATAIFLYELSKNSREPS